MKIHVLLLRADGEKATVDLCKTERIALKTVFMLFINCLTGPVNGVICKTNHPGIGFIRHSLRTMKIVWNGK